MLKSVVVFVNDLRRSRKAAKLCKEGERLYRANRIAEAIAPLLEAMALVGEPREKSTSMGVQVSINVSAVTLLASSVFG